MKRAIILAVFLGAAVADAEPRAYTWFDGAAPVRAFIDSSAIARVQASVRGRPARVAIEPVKSRRDRAELARGVLPAAMRAGCSPVFTPTPDGGRRMALPGGVIVYLDTALSPERAQAWLADRHLTVLQGVPTDPLGFVVASGPGPEAIELANQLRTEPGVRSASPLIWRESSPR